MRIKLGCDRKATSVKPKNSFARLGKYETWPCSVLVNFCLWKLWWRLKCCVQWQLRVESASPVEFYVQ